MIQNTDQELQLMAQAEQSGLESFLSLAQPIWDAYPETREPLEREQPSDTFETPKFL